MATLKSAPSNVVKTIKTTDGISHEISAKYWDGWSVNDLMDTLHGVVETYVIDTDAVTSSTASITKDNFLDYVIAGEGLGSLSGAQKEDLWSSVKVGDVILNKQSKLPDFWVTGVNATSVSLAILETQMPDHHHAVEGEAVSVNTVTSVVYGDYKYAVVASSVSVITGLGDETTTKPTVDYIISGITHTSDAITPSISISDGANQVGEHSHSYASTVAASTTSFIKAEGGLATTQVTFAKVSTVDAIVDVPALETTNIHTHGDSFNAAGEATDGTAFSYLIAIPELTLADAAAPASQGDEIQVITSLAVGEENLQTGAASSVDTDETTAVVESADAHSHDVTIAEHSHSVTFETTETEAYYSTAAAAAGSNAGVVGAWVDENELYFPMATATVTINSNAQQVVACSYAGEHSHTLESHTHGIGNHTHTYHSTIAAETTTLNNHTHENVAYVTGYANGVQTLGDIYYGSYTPHTHADSQQVAGALSTTFVSVVTGYSTARAGYTSENFSGLFKSINVADANEETMAVITGVSSSAYAITSLKLAESKTVATANTSIGLSVGGTISVSNPTISYRPFTTGTVYNAKSSGVQPITSITTTSTTLFTLTGLTVYTSDNLV